MDADARVLRGFRDFRVAWPFLSVSQLISKFMMRPGRLFAFHSVSTFLFTENLNYLVNKSGT